MFVPQMRKNVADKVPKVCTKKTISVIWTVVFKWKMYSLFMSWQMQDKQWSSHISVWVMQPVAMLEQNKPPQYNKHFCTVHAMNKYTMLAYKL